MSVIFGRTMRLFDESGDTGGTGNGQGALPSADDIAKLVNQAVTSQLSRALPKALEGVTATFSKSLEEKLAALKPAQPAADQSPTVDASKASPEFVAMQRKLEELLAANKAAEERAVAVERRAREDAAYGELRTLLAKDVKPEFVDTLAKALYYADKRVEFGEDNRALFKVMIPAYQGGPLQETQLPLRDGIEAFLKSKEAEPYRPPPQVKAPQFPAGRLPQQNLSQSQSSTGKIPSVLEDPTFASKMAAELAAMGVPTGAID